MSLEQLAVVSAPQITFDPKYPDRITVEFTPTVPHCGMSTFIGKSTLADAYSLTDGLRFAIYPRSLHTGALAAKSSPAVQGGHQGQAGFASKRARTYVSRPL